MKAVLDNYIKENEAYSCDKLDINRNKSKKTNITFG